MSVQSVQLSATISHSASGITRATYGSISAVADILSITRLPKGME